MVLEYFQRTGSNSISDRKTIDRLRGDITRLTGENEYAVLYPGESRTTEGSQSKHTCTNPTLIIYWMHVSVGRVMGCGACPPPVVSNLMSKLSDLAADVGAMDTIDKTQFPLPYAQLSKLLTIFFVLVLPFFIVSGSGLWTPLVCLVPAVGYFGLDEVSDILESPFGCDANDIDMWELGDALMSDLVMIHNSRAMNFDTVFSTASDLEICLRQTTRRPSDVMRQDSSDRLRMLSQVNSGHIFHHKVQPLPSDPNVSPLHEITEISLQ